MYMSLRFSCCCVRKKKKREVDQRTLVLASSLSKNKYISRERTKEEEGYTYSPVTQCRCREKKMKKMKKKKKKTHYQLTTMLLMNDHYRLMANLDDRNYKQPLHEHCQSQSRKNYYHLYLNHHQHHHYLKHLLMNNHHHQTINNNKQNLFYFIRKETFLRYSHVDDYCGKHFHHYVFVDVVVEDMSSLEKIYKVVVVVDY